MENKVYLLMCRESLENYYEDGDSEVEYVKAVFSNMDAAIKTLNYVFNDVADKSIPNIIVGSRTGREAQGGIVESYYSYDGTNFRFWIEEWAVLRDPVYSEEVIK